MKDLKAKDIMNTDVLSVRDDMTVQELAGFLTERESWVHRWWIRRAKS